MTVPIRTSGAITARSRTIRIRKTTRRMIGGITFESQLAASRTANYTAVGAPAPAAGGGGLADRLARGEGVGRVGVGLEYGLDQEPGLSLGNRLRDAFDAADLGYRLPHRAHFGSPWHDDVGQGGGPGREALVEQVLPFGRLDFGAVAVFAGQVGREGGEAEAEDQQQADRAEHDPAGGDRDAIAEPRPKTGGGGGGVLEPMTANLVGREDGAVGGDD